MSTLKSLYILYLKHQHYYYHLYSSSVDFRSIKSFFKYQESFETIWYEKKQLQLMEFERGLSGRRMYVVVQKPIFYSMNHLVVAR